MQSKNSPEGGQANIETYRHGRGLERAAQSEKAGKAVIDSQSSRIKQLLARRNELVGLKDTTEVENEKEDKDLVKQTNDVFAQLSPETVSELRKEAQGYLSNFMRKRSVLKDVKAELSEAVTELINSVHGSSERENAVVWQEIAMVEDEIEKTDEMIEKASRENPIAFEAHWLLNLREWQKSYAEKGLIETAAIRKQTERLMNDARKKLEGTNGVVALLGPTGSGKTVLAKKIAAQFSPDGQFEFVSAHPKMTADDLVERMGIKVAELPPEKVPEVIRDAKKRYQAENPNASEEDLNTIEDVIRGRQSQKVLETAKILEAVGRAAAEGRMVVIDEFNYLPPDTLASLNNFLSPDAKTKKGFGIILTGNIGKAYLKRQPLDPALINRILSGSVEYEYPPQELDRPLADSIATNEALAGGAKVADRDLFQIAVTHLIDSKGNLLAPESALDQVWNLAKIFALYGKLASGKSFRDLGIGSTAGQDISAFKFEHIALSFRNLNQVVREWKLDGFKKPLDWYIWQDIVKPAAIFSEKEAAQLYYLFHDWSGFMQGDSWNDLNLDTVNWRLTGLEKVKEPRNKKVDLVPVLPAELASAVSGMALPEFSQSTEVEEDKEKNAEQERTVAEMEKALAEEQTLFDKEINIEEFCLKHGEMLAGLEAQNASSV